MLHERLGHNHLSSTSKDVIRISLQQPFPSPCRNTIDYQAWVLSVGLTQKFSILPIRQFFENCTYWIVRNDDTSTYICILLCKEWPFLLNLKKVPHSHLREWNTMAMWFLVVVYMMYSTSLFNTANSFMSSQQSQSVTTALALI